MRVMPDGKMPIGIAWHNTVLNGIAIREQNWGGCLLGVNAYRINGKHVRPVIVKGDATETLRFALCAIDVARPIKP